MGRMDTCICMAESLCCPPEAITAWLVGCTPYNMCLVAQSCPTLCNPVDCSPPGSSIHEDSPGQNTELGSLSLLQGIFPTPGIEPLSPALQADSYHLSHQGSQYKVKKQKKHVRIISQRRGRRNSDIIKHILCAKDLVENVFTYFS